MLVRVDGPFDFALTAGHLTRYRGRDGADVLRADTYYRALSSPDGRTLHATDGRVLVAACSPTAGGVEVWLPNGGSPAEEAQACAQMGRLLALDVDLGGFYALMAADPVLSGAVGSLRGLRPGQAASLFEALAQAVIGQQISAAVARVIREGLVSTLGEPVEADGLSLHAFPEPAAVLEAGAQGLRALKLSARKADYLLDMAARTQSGELSAERLVGLDDEAAIAVLTAVRGVGRWTAAWALLQALGRLDVLPAGDLALQRTVASLYQQGAPLTEAALSAFAAQRWRPYRGLATVYLFAHLRRLRAAQQEGAQ